MQLTPYYFTPNSAHTHTHTHFISFTLSHPLYYSLKITNYGMKEKTSVCAYGCLSVWRYIKGRRKSHIYTQPHFKSHMYALHKKRLIVKRLKPHMLLTSKKVLCFPIWCRKNNFAILLQKMEGWLALSAILNPKDFRVIYPWSL